MSRVRIGTCSGPADAAIIRSMFAGHGIPAVVGAEHHAGMLGGLGGGFLSLDIWVDSEDEEPATALLREFRDSDGSGDDDDDDDDDDDAFDDGAFDREPDAAARDAADAAGDAAGTFGVRTDRSPGAADSVRLRTELHRTDRSPGAADSVRIRTELRRRTGIVLLLGCFLTFGTAHMFTRAWRRGIALAGLEIFGLAYVGVRYEAGFVAMGAILADLIGGLWRVRTAPRSVLPEARVRGS